MRDEMTSGIDVRKEVDLPHPLPVRIRALLRTFEGDAGVGTEQLDRSQLCLGGFDQTDVVFFHRDICDYCQRVELAGESAKTYLVEVPERNLGPRVGEGSGQGCADSAGGSGDNCHLAGQFHRYKLAGASWVTGAVTAGSKPLACGSSWVLKNRASPTRPLE